MKITALNSNKDNRSVEISLNSSEIDLIARALNASINVNAENEHLAKIFEDINQLVQTGTIEAWNKNLSKFINL